MKTKFIFLLALVFVWGTYAQEAGKAGKLLPNELNTTELKNKTTPHNENKISNHKNPTTDRVSGFRNEEHYPPNGNYHFNYSMGTSELFLRIPEMGKFTVHVGNQMISNATGKYRFFDIQAGNYPILIYRNNYLVYRSRVEIPHHSRLIVDFFSGHGLYLLDIVPVRMQSYGFNAWDDVWNAPYHSGQNYGNPYYRPAMHPADFKKLIKNLQQASFDDDKIRNIRMAIRNTNFYAKQIAEIINVISFDKKQIALSKELYAYCIDPQNYHVVIDVLRFTSSKIEVQDYIIRQGY